MVTSAIAYADARPQEISFPPSTPLTPAQVPRGVRAVDPPEAWEHLTWRSLNFAFSKRDPQGFALPHRFATPPPGLAPLRPAALWISLCELPEQEATCPQ